METAESTENCIENVHGDVRGSAQSVIALSVTDVQITLRVLSFPFISGRGPILCILGISPLPFIPFPSSQFFLAYSCPCVDDVRTSLEARDFTACYRDSFTLLCVDDVRTSLEAHDFTACYRDSFTLLYVGNVRTSQETPIGLHHMLRGIALLVYI
jgi:hypothetical protein